MQFSLYYVYRWLAFFFSDLKPWQLSLSAIRTAWALPMLRATYCCSAVELLVITLPKPFFNAKEGTAWCNSLFIMFTVGSPFFSDPRGMNYIHPSRDQSLKGSPIVKSYLYLDSSRFPQPARHELCPCCVRPIAAPLSSFWQLLYLYLPLMQNRELLMQFPIYLCYHWFAFFSATHAGWIISILRVTNR